MLFGTARLLRYLNWNSPYRNIGLAIFSISDEQSERHMGSGMRRSDGNFDKNLENAREYPHKHILPETRVRADHFAVG